MGAMNTFLRRSGAALAAVSMLTMASAALADVTGSAGWSRATVPGAKEAVGYLVLTNNGDEERSLLKITSPLCDRVSIHRSSVDSEGVARMWPVGRVKLEPGETLTFNPNALHLMFNDIKQPFKVGDKVPLTLQFDGLEKPFTVMLEVRPLVPEKASSGDHGSPMR
jgi:periplasmic copper chaperone A